MCVCVRAHACSCLHSLAVVEQNISELFGHHVQVPLLSFMGASQYVQLGEIWRQVVESSTADKEISQNKVNDG